MNGVCSFAVPIGLGTKIWLVILVASLVSMSLVYGIALLIKRIATLIKKK